MNTYIYIHICKAYTKYLHNVTETISALFAYTDFQNCRRSSARSQTKTKIVHKDASIGGKDDDLWRFQFCYRYWQKNVSIGRKKCQYWQKMPEMCSCDGGFIHQKMNFEDAVFIL